MSSPCLRDVLRSSIFDSFPRACRRAPRVECSATHGSGPAACARANSSSRYRTRRRRLCDAGTWRNRFRTLHRCNRLRSRFRDASQAQPNAHCVPCSCNLVLRTRLHVREASGRCVRTPRIRRAFAENSRSASRRCYTSRRAARPRRLHDTQALDVVRVHTRLPLRSQRCAKRPRAVRVHERSACASCARAFSGTRSNVQRPAANAATRL